MKLTRRTLLQTAGTGIALPSALAREKAAVVIYGATPGGIAAAVAAARLGQSVLLCEYEDHIGGIVSNAFVIQHSGVTVETLTIDGNGNGSLSGTQNFRAGAVDIHCTNWAGREPAPRAVDIHCTNFWVGHWVHMTARLSWSEAMPPQAVAKSPDFI